MTDEPEEAPAATAVEALVPDDAHSPCEAHEELVAALEESSAQFARGDYEDAHAFARRLVAKS